MLLICHHTAVILLSMQQQQLHNHCICSLRADIILPSSLLQLLVLIIWVIPLAAMLELVWRLQLLEHKWVRVINISWSFQFDQELLKRIYQSLWLFGTDTGYRKKQRLKATD